MNCQKDGSCRVKLNDLIISVCICINLSWRSLYQSDRCFMSSPSQSRYSQWGSGPDWSISWNDILCSLNHSFTTSLMVLGCVQALFYAREKWETTQCISEITCLTATSIFWTFVDLIILESLFLKTYCSSCFYQVRQSQHTFSALLSVCHFIKTGSVSVCLCSLTCKLI